jgi:hypothetical protein
VASRIASLMAVMPKRLGVKTVATPAERKASVAYPLPVHVEVPQRHVIQTAHRVEAAQQAPMCHAAQSASAASLFHQLEVWAMAQVSRAVLIDRSLPRSAVPGNASHQPGTTSGP